MRLLRLGHFAAPLAALAALACGGDNLTLPPDGNPSRGTSARIVKAGDGQVGQPGSPLDFPVQIRVVDDSGEGLPGRTVNWVVATGGGTTSPVSSVTDDAGYASATWTLGSVGENSLTAVVPGVGDATFTALANAEDDDGSVGPPSAAASTVSADPSSIQVGATSTIRVTVRDSDGTPVPGAIVTLVATGSGNTVTQPAGPTGADGVATGTLKSSVPGTKDVSAVVNGDLQILQTAQVFVAISPATRIERLEGNNQTARTGEAVEVPPAVRVTNSLGQPVSGYGVTFVVTAGGGSVIAASQTTNSQGIARVGGWILGSPRENRLEARAGSLSGSPVVFTAIATEPPPPPPPPPAAKPHHFVFLQQPPAEVREDEQFRVRVAIVDVDGNIVPMDGIEIYLGLFRQGEDEPSNSRLLGDRFEDTRDGVAEFKLRVTNGNFGERTGTTERGYRFRALSDELPELGPYGPEPFLFSSPFDVIGR